MYALTSMTAATQSRNCQTTAHEGESPRLKEGLLGNYSTSAAGGGSMELLLGNYPDMFIIGFTAMVEATPAMLYPYASL